MARRRTVLKESCKYTIAERFEEYICEKRARNLAPKTITCYMESFDKFGLVIDTSMYVNDLTSKDIDEFATYMLEEDISESSINHYLRDIKAFVNWCIKNNYIENGFKIELIRYQETQKEPYTDEEIMKLLEPPKDKKNFVELRTFTMIQWILATGNRISTIVNIKNKDIDFKNKTITLTHTKNRKLQVIPLSDNLAKAVRSYQKKISKMGITSEYLFFNVYGEKLTTNAIKQALRDYNLARGVSKTSAHLLRHTFAKNYISQGGDCMALQKILGHSTITMTRKYVNLCTADLQKNFDSFCLLDRVSSPNSGKRRVTTLAS